MAGSFDYSLISRIQQANDIVDVVSEHLRLDKKGKELVGLCPFHSDHRPSLYVSPAKQIFKCFACGAGGDVLKFVQMRENLTFPQAVERLAQRAGIALDPSWKKRQSAGNEPSAETLARINRWAMQVWQQNLWHPEKGAAARQYLEQRKIAKDIARQWNLGLALDSWDDLTARAAIAKIKSALLVSAGLSVPKDTGGVYDKFRNRLMFPILDVSGRVIGFGGRTLANDPAKYMNSPSTLLFDKSRCLYGLYQARHAVVESGTAVVVEGYTDALMAHQHGIRNVVATLGTSFTEGHAHLLRRFAKRIILLFDSDTAGRAAAERALEICLSEKIDIRMAFVPEGKDPCDYILQAGPEAFKRVLDNAQDIFEYSWKRLQEQVEQSDTLRDRAEAARTFLQHVAAGITTGKIDTISRTILLSRLSSLLNVPVSRIEAELKKIIKKSEISNPDEPKNPSSVHYIIEAQREVLRALLNEPGLMAEEEGKIQSELFTEPILKEIADVLLTALCDGLEPTIAQLCGHFESPQTAQTIVQLYEEGQQTGHLRSRLHKALEVLREDLRIREKEAFKAAATGSDDQALRKVDEIARTQKGNPRSGILKL
ncbi:MAG: DNA primase [Anaerohalosphaeraceae bacterium]